MRDIWEDYFVEAQAIIYMVDLSDEARLQEAHEGLQTVLASRARGVPLQNCVLLVLANKCDKPKVCLLNVSPESNPHQPQRRTNQR